MSRKVIKLRGMMMTAQHPPNGNWVNLAESQHPPRRVKGPRHQPKRKK